MAEVSRTGDKYTVRHNDAIVVVVQTNREAWRLADKLNGELINKAQDTSEWISRTNDT